MKQSKFILGFFALVIAFSISSCGDDDDGPSKTSLLTSKSWKVTDQKVNGVSTYNDSFDDCDRDDLTKFGTDGKVTGDEGAVKCDTSSPQTYSIGVWVFENNESKLKITDDSGDSEIYDIKELTSSSMKLSQSTTISGITLTVELSLSGQ